MREGHLIHLLWDGVRLGDANGLKHRAMPEASTSLVGSEGKDGAESQDALDRAGDDSKRQNLSIVLIPSLDIESQGS